MQKLYKEEFEYKVGNLKLNFIFTNGKFLRGVLTGGRFSFEFHTLYDFRKFCKDIEDANTDMTKIFGD